jgi:16S rRNA (adenine1518-N6/adenine1519-N6)-dimethyltransferase
MNEISLLGAAEIRRLALELDLSPSKGLGQNFVHDSNTCEKIVRLAELSSDDLVLEVGPGLGSLTLAILRSGARVKAVEIDQRLASLLEKTAKEHGYLAETKKLEVLNKDAMNLNREDLKGVTKLVANLPYNVSVPVILHLFELNAISSALVMVQSEVAARLAASPGSKTYGAPSVKLNWYGDAKVVDKVSRTVFWPEPRVDSSLLLIKRKADSIDGIRLNDGGFDRHDESLRIKTFEVIDLAFNQRRKMLRSSLAKMLKEPTEILERAGVDPTARAESLAIDDFVAIAKTI